MSPNEENVIRAAIELIQMRDASAHIPIDTRQAEKALEAAVRELNNEHEGEWSPNPPFNRWDPEVMERFTK